MPGRTLEGGKVGQSPRKKGLKQGLFIFLLTFLAVPIAAMFSQAVGLRPVLAGITAVLFFMGGILRMVYALMFEEAGPSVFVDTASPAYLHQAPAHGALPPQSTYPVDHFNQPAAGNWRDTNDLTPSSVTEGTTRLLEKDRD
nr:hypothetical protein [uncultured bacterium]